MENWILEKYIVVVTPVCEALRLEAEFAEILVLTASVLDDTLSI